MMLEKHSRRADTFHASDLSRLYVLNRLKLVAYAERILKDRALAEDVVQESMMKLILASPNLKDESHALAYLTRVVNNQSIDVLRSKGRRPALVSLDEVSAEMELISSDLPTQIDTLESAEDAAIIRQALSLLSPAERAALVMWEIQGRSTKEIALELGINDKTVKHTLSRARKSLKNILTNYVIDEKRGLTALQLLSSTFERSKSVLEKSSKATLAVIFVLASSLLIGNFSFNGRNSAVSPNASLEKSSLIDNLQNSAGTLNLSPGNQKNVSRKEIEAKIANSNSSSQTIRSAPVSFKGLDGTGLPTSFTINDSNGSFGSLGFFPKDTVFDESTVTSSSIVKTTSEAANVLITQSIRQDMSGLRYEALLSYGRDGSWVPLMSRVQNTEVERLISGLYLVTSVIQVEAEIRSPIVVPATAGGHDLPTPPRRILIRILLDDSKSRIVKQAIQVVL